ncbi:flavin reductase family protein [Catalinimonas niigatensis]|uniref:flavin reductase family protein n=1 Tax=Catalinimonas niigatensis TaxID=1397264 RepID=UPI00266513B8|nr:flavin reductase family protein [Catalinimonas niigatensis]WPP53111.1 flavin reductase family protein [Catalinimonas niigatensis]
MNRERKINKHNELSQALKKITYGFYIVTSKNKSEQMATRDDDYIAAGTVSWVSQASFDPPLVTVAVNKESDLHETIGKSRVFAVNIVGKEGGDMLSSFAKDSLVEGNKINGFSFSEGDTGSPILEDVPAYFECELREEVTIGDHSIFVGEVVGGATRDEDAVPLTEWEADLHYGG